MKHRQGWALEQGEFSGRDGSLPARSRPPFIHPFSPCLLSTDHVLGARETVADKTGQVLAALSLHSRDVCRQTMNKEIDKVILDHGEGYAGNKMWSLDCFLREGS